ncbi:MAG: NAD(P)H-dependent oxidoreductase subunit E [bacterium]|nr:NAD(P)H-dependent oxidoreductase subunit E [bacterium]
MSNEKQKTGSVLVVGGGIGGMQAASDLSEAGFRVYLVEEGPAIGGRMSQLDKTFPTNDCAMCIMGPRLVEVGNSLNIKLLTNSEITRVEGYPGNFKVEVLRHPRYVNEERCTGCGTCTEACLTRNRPYFEAVEPPVRLDPKDEERVTGIINTYQAKKEYLLAILQDVQAEYNYLPEDVLRYIANRLNLPVSSAYSLATYYTAFSLTPKGRHIINICLGTACHVRGVDRIVERLERDLSISCGETTQDLAFTLEGVRCLGCCSLSPVMTINGKTYGNLTQDGASKIIERIWKEDQ